MVLVKARVKLTGLKASYSTSAALADSGARMSLVEKHLAEHIGVKYTGRQINFISLSGHAIKASEAIVPEMKIEGEALKYEVIAVTEIPSTVKKTLRENRLDENVIIGTLTLERANMIPNTTTGKLQKAESFILLSSQSPHTSC